MAISERTIKNKRDKDGMPTGKKGTVYDVNVKHIVNGVQKTYAKRGFLTKTEARKHEAEMLVKLKNPSYTPLPTSHGKRLLKDYLLEWVEIHGKANLRPSTFSSYKGNIINYIIPSVGNVRLNQLTSEMIDNLLQGIFERGLSQSTARYVHRVLSVALEAARKYRYIDNNPARDIITKFGKEGETPAPLNIEETQQLIASVLGTELEVPVIIDISYGLRISELIGQRCINIDLDKRQFNVCEQMPFDVPSGAKTVDKLAPTKGAKRVSDGRILPITDITYPFFEKQFDLRDSQKAFILASGAEYYDNGFLLCKPDGSPYRRDRLSASFRDHLRRSGLRHIRFHDLRKSFATNCYSLTGDFYSVGAILGHSLKGIGRTLGISTNFEAETARYVDVRIERMREVLEIYHKAILDTGNACVAAKKPRKPRNPNAKSSQLRG